MPTQPDTAPNVISNVISTVPNFISQDVEIVGTVRFGKALTVHGKIVGDVHASGTLTLGENGRIEGNIRAASISIEGTVKGNVTVRDRCELKRAARLIGDLEAPRLIIEDGATFVGLSKVGPVPPAKAAT